MRHSPPPSPPEDTLAGYRQYAEPHLRQLHSLSREIESAPGQTQKLTAKWSSICDQMYVPSRPNLLPTVLQTFNETTDQGLRTAAAEQVIKLIYFYEGESSDDTLAGISRTLSDVHSFAVKSGNRPLQRQVREKRADFEAQLQSLDA